jgi:hypothetical protein
MKSEPFTKRTPRNEAAPPPLADARRRAKYSLHFWICARPRKIFSIKEVGILLGSALNEQAAGLASVFCSGAAEFPPHTPLPPRPRVLRRRNLYFASQNTPQEKMLPLPHTARARATIRHSLFACSSFGKLLSLKLKDKYI